MPPRPPVREMTFGEGKIVVLSTSLCRPADVGVHINGTPCPSTLRVRLIARHPGTRSWKVRYELDGKEGVYSSRTLKEMLYTPSSSSSSSFSNPIPDVPNAFQPAAALPIVHGNPIIILDDDLKSDNEDSADDGADNGSDSDEPLLPPDSDLLSPHGLRWLTLAGISVADNLPVNPRSTTLRWADIGGDLMQFGPPDSVAFDEGAAQLPSSRVPLHYFWLSFPMKRVPFIISATNQQRNNLNLSAGKFFKVLGIMYLMCLVQYPNREMYFKTTNSGAFPSPNFASRFGMSFTEFNTLLNGIQWSSRRSGVTDKWFTVRDFIDGFNDRRVSAVEPGERIVVDESMSANRTQRTAAHNVMGGLPHQTKIARKPEGVGVEIRTALACDSQIMLRLEIQESKEDMATKPFISPEVKSGTACVLRLVLPWHNTGRIIYGDSAFASVSTAMNLRQRGLHFIGLVKTAHRHFPKQYFNTLNKPIRSGESVYLKSKPNNTTDLTAVGWWDKQIKTFVATIGGNQSAPAHVRTRYIIADNGSTQQISKSTPITSIPYDYFSNAQKIDVHNHRRQGVLAVERNIATRNWIVRFISTIIGIIMVDAYMMYKLENDVEQQEINGFQIPKILTFQNFVESVGLGLASNTIDSKKRRASLSLDDVDAPANHTLGFLRDHPAALGMKAKKKQRRCKECNVYTSYICIACSLGSTCTSICSGVCKDGQPKECLTKHIGRFS